MNYYNEIDVYAADWIENLIAAELIPAGQVDRRSIEDVTPADLAGFTQCHFFAGIAGWSLALAIAGWPADRPIWTGSCPCQPFSTAGAQAGFDDERHLWPAFHWLIAQCQPSIVVGEQVASKTADAWIDLVRTDMEALGAAFGAVAFPSASVGAPHIRDRTYWTGISPGQRCEGFRQEPKHRIVMQTVESRFGRMADSNNQRLNTTPIIQLPTDTQRHFESRSVVGGMDNSYRQPTENEVPAGWKFDRMPSIAGNPGPTNGYWSAADWLACRDSKWRPVEPGTFPLAHGVPGRVGRLRAYGNAINPWQAAEFIACIP